MKFRTVAVSFASVVLLTACSGEPTESEMKGALDTHLSNPLFSSMQVELVSLKKIGCEKRHKSSYVCDYESEGKMLGRTQKGVNTATFIKSSEGWVMQAE